MLCNRIFWPSVLLLLCYPTPSKQDLAFDGLFNELADLKYLIDSKLTQVQSELNNINTRMDSIDQDIAVMKDTLDGSDSKLTQVQSELNNINTRMDSIDRDIAVMKDSPQLVFNLQEITIFNQTTVTLSCGVIGTFESCSWEHKSDIYKLNDVLRNRYPDLSVESNTAADQQCGITIKKATGVHEGSWTCKVLTSSGRNLSATKTLTIIPYGFEIFSYYVVRVPKKTDKSWSSDKRMSYNSSLDLCSSKGAVPFIPRTSEEFDFMVHVVETRLGGGWDGFMWFPATDIDTEGQLIWADGTDASTSSVIRWCNNQTLYGNSESKDCGQIGSYCDKGVEIDSCHVDAFPMICEILSS